MAEQLFVPWLDLGLQFGISGAPRFVVNPTLGVLFRFQPTSPMWFGVHAGLMQIFPGTPTSGFQSYPASVISIGLSLEFFPTPRRDSDGDGFPDNVDECPDKPGVAPRGCPEEAPAQDLDADHDRVLLPLDKCPDQPEDPDGFEDDDGCPDPDNDGDGVLDAADSCPSEVGPLALLGCADRDGDGVADRQDLCPDKPGSPDGGCPTYKQVVVTKERIEIKQRVHFAYARTTILPKSAPLLDEVVQALKDRPALCVRVEGHADSTGTAAFNRTLSAGRAAAIVDFLVHAGIDSARLGSKGYGADLPLDANTTADGRELNRRVEFIIVKCPE
jgi:outer membrane protein OmpA-like peptidoglycan-associated protein